MSNPTSIFRVTIGGGTTTRQIAKALRKAGSYVSDSIIRSKFFALPPHSEEDVEIEIICGPKYRLNEKLGLWLLEDAGLERPTCEHALRFAEQWGMRTTSKKKPFIIFLHKPWQSIYHSRRVLF